MSQPKYTFIFLAFKNWGKLQLIQFQADPLISKIIKG